MFAKLNLTSVGSAEYGQQDMPASSPRHLSRALDGNYVTAWVTPKNQAGVCLSQNWLQIRLAGDDITRDQTAVYTRSVRIHVRPRAAIIAALGGAQLRVGNTTSRQDSVLCALVPGRGTASALQVLGADHAMLSMSCNASALYLFLVQPAAVCLEILELEVVGRRHACTGCASGTYEDQAGSTACKSCPWAWAASDPWATTSLDNAVSIHDCQCPLGFTGEASRSAPNSWLFTQDVASERPQLKSWMALDSPPPAPPRTSNVSVVFNRSAAQFLHAPSRVTGSGETVPRAWRLASRGVSAAVRIKLSSRYLSQPSTHLNETMSPFLQVHAAADCCRLNGAKLVASSTADGVAARPVDCKALCLADPQCSSFSHSAKRGHCHLCSGNVSTPVKGLETHAR